MKTIRENVFETNSSSTHSLTIRKIDKDTAPVPYVEDGIVNLDALEFNAGGGTRESRMTLSTKDQKATWLLSWFNRELTWFVKSLNEETVDEWKNYILNKLGYTGIKGDVCGSWFDDIPSDIKEITNSYSMLGTSSKIPYDKIDAFIKDVVLDDTMEISHIIYHP